MSPAASETLAGADKPFRREFFEPHLGVYLELSASSDFDEQNHTVTSVHILKDISDRKELENRLRMAKKLKEQMQEAKEQLLGKISHEFRTPMNSILGFTEILSDESLTDDQKDYVAIINHTGKYLLNVINDLLDFSAIEAKKVDLEIVECSLEEILSQVNSQTALKAAQKKLDLKIHVCEDLTTHIVTDPAHLTQCLVHLVKNAIKFTDKGHVCVTVSSDDMDGQARLRFEVEDTGIGIAAEKQEIIFEPFIQADGGLNRQYGGMGLGLAITRKLVELLGGHLTVSSQAGSGSTFSLAMPLQNTQTQGVQFK